MIVWSNGCYDLVHLGHYNLLQYCKYIAGTPGLVIVGIDSDEKIRNSKGNARPLFSQEERKNHLLSLKYGNMSLIDKVYIFNSPAELYNLVQSINPDAMVIGEDWKGKPVVGEDLVSYKSSIGPRFGLHFYPKVSGISTTEIIKRCQKS